MRIVVRGKNDVGPVTDVCGDCGLGTDVFPVFGVDGDFDARLLGEFPGIGQPLVLITLNEAFPAQNPQFGARFRLEGQLLRLRFARQHRRAERSAGSSRSLQKMTP